MALKEERRGNMGAIGLSDIRYEDLLGRDSIKLECGSLDTVFGKTVLVSGGGGSIGSEICRQVAAMKPRKLVILDISENNSYSVLNELAAEHPFLDVAVVIGSVRDKVRLERIFDSYRPQAVFHAAAHKHVPLMEDSPGEAVKNNIIGTLNIAEAAGKYGAERFVLISTDKAVNPTSVMGASKRICEMIVGVLAREYATKFACVRFGNVLGSSGSVVPLFMSQINRGGPVTVTDSDVIRYFMTIPEAVSLVLRVSLYADKGEIFVLDMGNPVRIDELARNLIRLCGYEPDKDIKIEYTGLRPGEKLFEELLLTGEGLEKTDNDLIYKGKAAEMDREELFGILQMLREAADSDGDEIRALLKKAVPEYHY